MATVNEALTKTLGTTLPSHALRALAAFLGSSGGNETGTLGLLEVNALLRRVDASLKLFAKNVPRPLLADVRRAVTGGRVPVAHRRRIAVASDADVIEVQRASFTLTEGVFGATDAVRMATAASEFARNIYMYAGRGEVEFVLSEENGRQQLAVVARDQGPGIPNLSEVLAGNYRSRTGLGRGLLGARELLDDFSVETAPGRGTVVRGRRVAR